MWKQNLNWQSTGLLILKSSHHSQRAHTVLQPSLCGPSLLLVQKIFRHEVTRNLHGPLPWSLLLGVSPLPHCLFSVAEPSSNHIWWNSLVRASCWDRLSTYHIDTLFLRRNWFRCMYIFSVLKGRDTFRILLGCHLGLDCPLHILLFFDMT